jgi:hypothetical protein
MNRAEEAEGAKTCSDRFPLDLQEDVEFDGQEGPKADLKKP